MLEKYARPLYQWIFVDPFAKLLVRLLPLSPSSITLIGCVFGVFAAISIGLGFVWSALFFLLLSGYCDTLDGTIARLRIATSPFGTMLDIVCDRIVEASLIIGLYALSPETRATICLLMLASVLICITSFLIVGIFTEKQTEKSFYYSPGLIERGEAFIFFAAMILFPTLFNFLGWLFTILVLFTAFMRLYQWSIAIIFSGK